MITAHGLRKHYRGTAEGTGLNGLDLAVPAGSVCGLLGPNGAGKTTAVRILTTLLTADAGEATVAGYDVRRQAAQVRSSIGLVGQSAALDEVLTGRQNLEMFGRLHHLGAAPARRNAADLLDRFGLAEAADRPVRTYSGGMRRRLDLAASLVVAPAVLFVDEPTTGLDPRARRDVWAGIRDLVGSGTTVLLTTQYLEEADHLADRITMVSGGRAVVEGPPDELKAAIGGDRVDITVAGAAELERTVDAVRPVAAGEITMADDRLVVSVPVEQRTGALIRVAAALGGRGVEPVDVTLRRPTLDEVFLRVTDGGPAGGPTNDDPAKEAVA